MPHFLHFSFQLHHGVFTARELDIAVVHHITIHIEHDHGDGIIVVDDFQDKADVGIFVGIVERTHGFSPYRHFRTCVLLQITHQVMRKHQRNGSNDNCHNNQ